MRRETRDERRQETIRRWTGDIRRRDRKKKTFWKNKKMNYSSTNSASRGRQSEKGLLCVMEF